MRDNDFLKKFSSKAGAGVLFVAACFIAAFILFEFHDNYLVVGIAAVILLLAAYLFLNVLFEEKAKEWSHLQDEEEFPGRNDGEFRLRVTKYMKDTEGTQRDLLDTLKKQNEMLTEQIENLEHEIYMLSEKQLTQTKTVIRFNKENARQLALSQKEAVEKAVQELKEGTEYDREKQDSTIVEDDMMLYQTENTTNVDPSE